MKGHQMADFSHLGANGEGQMVDILGKKTTKRKATCQGSVAVSRQCHESLQPHMLEEIKRTARLAGILAAKKTSGLIPYCHQVPLSGMDIDISYEKGSFSLLATAKTKSETGVEMEAMVALSIAGATIYDMVKAIDPKASVGPFYLVAKEGGKSGLWQRD